MKRTHSKILIGMPVHDPEISLLHRALKSFFCQVGLIHTWHLLLVDDASSSNWLSPTQYLLDNNTVKITRVAYRDVPHVRNFIHDYATFHGYDYVARLDADDYLASSHVLRQIELILEHDHFDVLFASNLQDIKGEKRANIFTPNLLQLPVLYDRLQKMAAGNCTAELPSCNTIVSTQVTTRYPDVPSAEDHWYTVFLILQQQRYKVRIASDIIYAVYRIGGRTTADNKRTGKYVLSRKQLLSYFLSAVGDETCKEITRKSLP